MLPGGGGGIREAPFEACQSRAIVTTAPSGWPDDQAVECRQCHCHIGWARQAARGARMSSGAQAPTDGLIT